MHKIVKARNKKELLGGIANKSFQKANNLKEYLFSIYLKEKKAPGTFFF